MREFSDSSGEELLIMQSTIDSADDFSLSEKETFKKRVTINDILSVSDSHTGLFLPCLQGEWIHPVWRKANDGEGHLGDTV